MDLQSQLAANAFYHKTKVHWDAGVRVSMLRPRLMWSSISPAQPTIRPNRKAVKAALSRAADEKAPER